MDSSVKDLRKKVYDRITEANIEKNELKRLVNDKIDELLLGFGDSKEVSITFDELKLFKLGERNYINEGVYFEKIEESNNYQKFLTYASSGSTFGVHYHDCIEKTKVINGSLIEKTRGYKTYEEGQEVIYASKERHVPYAPTDSVWEVTFYKNI